MAEKKVSLNALRMQLGKLSKKEQTPEVMEQIDALKLQIETMEAEQAKSKPSTAPAPQAGSEGEKSSAFKTYEKWSLSMKVSGNQATFEKVKMLKEVRILEEHAQTLNLQKQNTLIEYIEKEG